MNDPDEAEVRDRRRLRNLLLEPRRQFRYGMHFFLFGAVAVLFVQWVSYRAIVEVVGRILTEAGHGDTLAPIVRESIGITMLQSGWLLPLIGGAGLLYAAWLFHRFIGPQIPIRHHLRRLAAGDYSGTCRIRGSDELHELCDEVNQLTERLRERRRKAADTAPRLRSIGSESGFSLIEVLAVLAVISVLGMLAVSQFISAYDRARQRGTLADMRSIASASGTFQIDNGAYAQTLPHLEPYYMNPVAPVDRWGTAWAYEADPDRYELRSLGSDTVLGPVPPEPWDDEPFECDLVVTTGVFTQAPATIRSSD
jgi:general secretion pathway protein G